MLPLLPPPLERDANRRYFHEVGADLWPVFFLMSQCEGLKSDARQLRESARVADLTSEYGVAHDAKDLAWTMDVYTQDVLRGRKGSDNCAEGSAEAEKLFDRWNVFHKFSRHRVANKVIRFFGEDQAWVTAYSDMGRTGHPGEVESYFGRYLWRAVKDDGRWRLADHISATPFKSNHETVAVNAALPDVRTAGRVRERAAAGHTGAAAAIDGGRVTFHALASDMDAAHKWLAATPQPELSTALVLQHEVDRNNAAERMTHYTYSFDAKDAAWMELQFAEDAIVRLGGELAEGRRNVMDALERAVRGTQKSHSVLSAPVIRFTPDRTTGWIGGALQTATVGAADERHVVYGRYFGRLTRDGGNWRIADLSLSADPRLGLVASHRARANPLVGGKSA